MASNGGTTDILSNSSAVKVPIAAAEAVNLPPVVPSVGGLASNAGSGSESEASGSLQQHPNIFVRGLPLAWGEVEITAIFQQFGNLNSLRLVRHSVTKQSLGYGFVRYDLPEEAAAAIAALDGTSVLGQTLQVKFADADAGPPTVVTSSGLTPSVSCYVKHLPASYGVVETQQLFEVYGGVVDVKLFPCLDQFRGASALVRMVSVEAAEQAINALNNITPLGGLQSLIVRYAESASEKEARLSRRERQQTLQQRNGLGDINIANIDPIHLQQAINVLNLAAVLPAANNAVGLGPATLIRAGSGGSIPVPTASVTPFVQAPIPQSSICVRGVPSNADRLWLYENFARFGGISGMRILIDEQTGLCNGTAFINYGDPVAAQKARQAMNGMIAGDKILNVAVQHYGGNTAGINAANGRPANISSSLPPPHLMGMNSLSAASDQSEWQHLLNPVNSANEIMWQRNNSS